MNLPSAPPATALISLRESVKIATVGYSIVFPESESATTPVIVIPGFTAFWALALKPEHSNAIQMNNIVLFIFVFVRFLLDLETCR